MTKQLYDTIEKQVDLVIKYPYNISKIKNPSEELQLIAVKKFPKVIQYLENPSEKVQFEAVKKSSSVIHLIENPSEKVQMRAVRGWVYVIDDIENPTKKVLDYILTKDVWFIFQVCKNKKVRDYIKKHSKKISQEDIRNLEK